MPDMIKDGTGGGYLVGVSSENRLLSECVTVDFSAHVSEEHATLYSWTTSHNSVDDEYVLCIKNNNPNSVLQIETIRASSDLATVWSAGFGTWATVGGGVEVVGGNANSVTNNVALATAHITATNFTPDASPLLQTYGSNGAERTFRPEGKIVLGFGDTFYIKNSIGSTAFMACTVWGYYHP